MLPNLDYERRLQALERFMREIHGDRGATEVSTWTPTWTGLTVVGAPTYSGRYTRIGRIIFWKVEITAGGANTTASSLGTTQITNMPFTIFKHNTIFTFSTVDGAYRSGGYALAASTVVYTPTWAAINYDFQISGWYEI